MSTGWKQPAWLLNSGYHLHVFQKVRLGGHKGGVAAHMRVSQRSRKSTYVAWICFTWHSIAQKPLTRELDSPKNDATGSGVRTWETCGCMHFAQTISYSIGVHMQYERERDTALPSVDSSPFSPRRDIFALCPRKSKIWISNFELQKAVSLNSVLLRSGRRFEVASSLSRPPISHHQRGTSWSVLSRELFVLLLALSLERIVVFVWLIYLPACHLQRPYKEN